MKTSIIIKNINNFTGYFVDKEGNIYSVLQKGCRDKFNMKKWKKAEKIKPRKTRNGYCRVCLKDDISGKRKDIYVHRIVAETFIPNVNNVSDVNHIDSNPEKNNVENLEWTSHKENLEYGFTHGNKTRNKLGQFSHK
jgi:hypothetical protein